MSGWTSKAGKSLVSRGWPQSVYYRIYSKTASTPTLRLFCKLIILYDYPMSKKTLTLIATILGSGVVFLDGTIVNLALPKISVGLGAHFSDLQWIADGYLLSLSSLILLGGSLGDIFGRKRIYLIGLAGFGTVSLLCGLSPSVGFLIGFRILQGVFGALLVPGGLAIIKIGRASC